ncbi:hypothetical protein KKJ22_08705 [Xenorhabdus bovienii]|nr:hypothetical protein [Xenorhabdus bovienii]MDE9457066.1 hypothetical protein [Xenorhabdus bovienii]MDE9460866.1 hypothetical protein [Xenorhabdus bovienii]MDE9464787.1 hypothetical protein [Xenorhabdus bovienii]MDE9468152.1 hypothetical protein [Xenorhabdus bovienii]
MEVVEDGGGRLSVVLAGHPKLRNDLRRPTMEEITGSQFIGYLKPAWGKENGRYSDD